MTGVEAFWTFIALVVASIATYIYGNEKDKKAEAEAERKKRERQRKEDERYRRHIQQERERQAKAEQKVRMKEEAVVAKEAARIEELALPDDVSLERIETRLDNFKQLVGKIEVQGVVTGAIFSETGKREIFYEVDLAEQTCTCANFKKKSFAPKNDIRRFCEHIMDAFKERDLFKRTNHRTLMVGELGCHAATQSAYALKHQELPLMYLLVEKENPWLNVYSREKEADETIYNASGYFLRHGYSILEKRWAWGSGVTGVTMLRDFFKSIKTLDDIELMVERFEEKREKPLLSELSDPRKNPNFNSDQYGTETDWYDVPESIMVSENSCEFSLLFTYVDGRGAESRRTVDFKKHQYYGTEGSYLYGFCRMRKSGRTFNTKRMTDAMDVNSGEIIENVREYAENYWTESAVAKLQIWASENERIAKAFLYLLRGSKRGAEADYHVLASIYSDMLGGVNVSMSDIQWLYSDQTPTTAVGFQRFVSGIIKNHPDQLSWFKESAIKLASARARPNFSDKAAIDYLNQRIP